MSISLQGWRQPLSFLAVAALLAGIYFRFQGLGSAPFAVDEYYLARSFENILRTGIPQFQCGGYYVRGIVLQYSSAALQAGGLTAEYAPRLICTLCSLLSIAATYILSRRIGGRMVALLAVIILALSVWEIEMARFGRMYAPFQAVFLWYLVFFLRYTVDRESKALWPMLILSVMGPLTWEGGVFLPLINLLSVFLRRWPDGRIERSDWPYLIACTVLLGLAYWFITADFRGYNAASWPLGYAPSESAGVPDVVTTLPLPMTAVLRHPWWLTVALIPVAGTLYSMQRIWLLRQRTFLAAGLCVILLAAAAHQFLAVVAIALLLLMTRLTTWPEFFGHRSGYLRVTVALWALFWVGFGLYIAVWHNAGVSGGVAARAAALIYQLLRFPDVITVVVRPWGKAVPHLGTGLLLLLAFALVRAARSQATANYERILLIVFMVLLLAASAGHPPREETRYVFFLYPVALIIALATIARAAASLSQRPAVVTGMTSAIALTGFALSEDFNAHHLLHIDSPAETFRTGMSQDMQSHLVIREDFRGIAQWLQQHVTDRDVIVNGVHGLDHYYAAFNYFYVDLHSPNFPDWSCRQGTVERWGNYPLLYTVGALGDKATAGSKLYLVDFSYDQAQTIASLAALHPRIVTSSGDVIIIELKG